MLRKCTNAIQIRFAAISLDLSGIFFVLYPAIRLLRVFVEKEEAVLKEPMFGGIVNQLLQKSVLIPRQRPLVFYDLLLL